jgi:tape measure domain-containing protein
VSTIGSAFVKVRADVSNFASDAKAGISKVGPPLAAAADKAIQFSKVAGAGLFAIGAYGVKSAATLEQTTTAFTSLLGSSKAAQDQIAALQKFAASTPFSQQDVLHYAQQFYAMSDSIGMAKSQVIPFETAIGNIGAVTGASSQNISAAITAIAQMGSAGKITSGDIRQLSDNLPGFNGVAAIAAATGKTSAQVMQEISAGSLSAQDGVKALVAGMNKFPGAAGAMQKQSQTLNGLWSTFTDTAKINLTNALTQSIPILKKTLDQITPIVGTATAQIAPVMANLVASIAPLIGPAIAGIAQILSVFAATIGPVFQTLAPVIKPLAGAIAGLVGAAKPLLELFAQMAKELIPPLIKILNPLIDVFQSLGEDLADALGPVLPVIADALASVGGALDDLLPVLGPLINQLAILFADALKAIVPLLAQLFVALMPVIGALAGAFTQVLAALGPQLPTIAIALGQLAVSLAKILIALTPLIPPLASLIALVVKIGAGAILLIIKEFTLTANVLAAVLGPAIRGVVGLFSNLGDKASAVTSAIRSAVSSTMNAVRGAVSTAVNFVTGVWSSGWNAVTGGARNVYTSVTGVLGSLIGWVRGMPGKIASAARGMWNGITGAFKTAIDGLIGLWNNIHFPELRISFPKIHIPGTNVNIGGGGFSFGPYYVPQIPYLADGAMTTGPMAAVIGDNPGGREVALPLNSPKTRDALADALGQAIADQRPAAPSGGSDAETLALLQQLVEHVGALAMQQIILRVSDRDIAVAARNGDMALGRTM